jgi:hypothetical protein
MNDSENAIRTSASNDEWLEIAEALRSLVRKRIEANPEATPDELKTLIESAKEAMFFEEWAKRI